MDVTWGNAAIAIVVIGPSASLIATFAALRQRFKDHEVQDDSRFVAVATALTSIGEDTKELLQRTAHLRIGAVQSKKED